MTAEAFSGTYIFEYQDGEKRKELVTKIIQSILCERRYEGAFAESERRIPAAIAGLPCGTCGSCIRARTGTHEDVHYMRSSGLSGYTVRDAENFMSRLSMRPYGHVNIGVIDKAERMSDIVQNKLLKTLEEPCPNTVILLVTANAEAILGTVRSRCIPLGYGGTQAHPSICSAYRNGETEDGIAEAAEGIEKGVPFYEFRGLIADQIKSREDAADFLNLLEENMRAAFMRGGSADVIARRIEMVEAARRDIAVGMGYKQAIKRLYFELNL